MTSASARSCQEGEKAFCFRSLKIWASVVEARGRGLGAADVGIDLKIEH